jgi:hypothetical protein
VLQAVALPSAAGIALWLSSFGLAQTVTIPFVAAATAALVAVVIIAGLAYWQRDDVRLLRAAAHREAV